MNNIKRFFILIAIVFTANILVTNSISAQVPPLANPSFETQAGSANEALSWFPFQNGYTRVQTAKTGTWGIKLSNTQTNTYSGIYQRVNFNQTTAKPIFIGGYVKGQNIINSSNGYFGASLYLEIVHTDGTITYWNTIANYGSFDWRWVGVNTATLPSNEKPISHIFVVPMLGLARGTAFFDDIKVQEYEPTSGAVTIMVDDGEISTYTDILPALNTFGFKGSAAIISGAIGDDGQMTKAQLVDLQNKGWEIVSHSVNHDDMTTLSNTRIKTELNTSKRTLERAGLSVQNFALPFGAYNGFILGEAQAGGYKSVRAYEQGDNPKGLFPFDVKVRGLLNTTPISEVESWLSNAKNNKKWTILTLHRIAPSSDDAYFLTSAQLKTIIQKVKDSGLPVITYKEGISQFATAQ